MFLPDIQTFLDDAHLPCLAYIGGTGVRSPIRIVGYIQSDGSVSDITLHGNFGCVDVSVPTPFWG